MRTGAFFDFGGDWARRHPTLVEKYGGGGGDVTAEDDGRLLAAVDEGLWRDFVGWVAENRFGPRAGSEGDAVDPRVTALAQVRVCLQRACLQRAAFVYRERRLFTESGVCLQRADCVLACLLACLLACTCTCTPARAVIIRMLPMLAQAVDDKNAGGANCDTEQWYPY